MTVLLDSDVLDVQCVLYGGLIGLKVFSSYWEIVKHLSSLCFFRSPLAPSAYTVPESFDQRHHGRHKGLSGHDCACFAAMLLLRVCSETAQPAVHCSCLPF